MKFLLILLIFTGQSCGNYPVTKQLQHKYAIDLLNLDDFLKKLRQDVSSENASGIKNSVKFPLEVRGDDDSSRIILNEGEFNAFFENFMNGPSEFDIQDKLSQKDTRPQKRRTKEDIIKSIEILNTTTWTEDNCSSIGPLVINMINGKWKIVAIYSTFKK